MARGLKSLSNLENLTFYIPDYQRGYRWTEEQVDSMLEDLKTFVEQTESDTFFLEPIVVRRLDDDKFELIDGQQRLTTLYLLGHILDAQLGENVKPIGYKLAYPESRENLEFMEQIAQNPLADSWEGSDSCPDYYFIANASHRIQEWLKKSIPRRILYNILDRLKEEVKFLWHDIQEDNGEGSISATETFERLNTGKIALTDGELCRSLLLVRQNVENELPELKGFSKEDKNFLLPTLRRSLIAKRQIIQADNWDDGEKLLHNQDFWEFLGNPEGFQTRMDFLLRLHYGLKPQYTDQYICFSKLYKEIGKSDEKEMYDGYSAWTGLKQSLQRLWDWYNDPDYYYWIGYLNRINSRHLPELLQMAQKLTIKEFTHEIIGRLRKTIRLNSLNLDHIQYESGSEKEPWRILFLFNVEYTRTRPLGFARFPFAEFTPNQSIEHINARNPGELKSSAQMEEWLQNRLVFLRLLEKRDIEEAFSGEQKLEAAEERGLSQNATKHINQLWQERGELVIEIANLFDAFSLLGKNDCAFELHEQYKILSEKFDKFMARIEEDEDINSLYNLCLIDKNINTHLGNDEFYGKQQKLRAILAEGKKYVPPATQALFMRHFMKKFFNRSWWSKDDRHAYRRMLHKTLSIFWPELEKEVEADSNE